MADFDPVEIRLDLVQNVDSEGKKSTAAIDEIAAASNKMKAQFEKDIASQKAMTTQLINELKLLKETMGKKVETGDDKQIVDKQKLAEQIDLLNKKLLEQEALLNKINQKAPGATSPTKVNANVDEYARQMRSLNMSMTQISREMPNFAISPMIGIMSLSNNLPMLQGDITRMIELNKQLKASGQSTVPVWKQLVSGLFSWQTALIAGISALMLWGPQIGSFISGLFKANDALSRLKKAQDELRNSTIEGNKDAQNNITRLDLLYKISTDVAKSMKDRNDAVNELQKMYPDYLGNIDDEAIKTGKAAGAYDKLRQSIIDAAVAKAYEKKITEAQSKIIDLEAERAVKVAEFNKQIASSSVISNTKGGNKILFGFGVAKAGFSQSAIDDIDKEIDDLTSKIQEYAKNINITDLLFGGKESKGGKAGDEKILGVYDQLLQKIDEAEKAVLNATETERPALQEKLRLLMAQRDAWEAVIKAQRGEITGMTPIKPIKAVIATDNIVDSKTLGAMKQLTAEQKKQLEQESDISELLKNDPEKLEKEVRLREEIVGYAMQLTDEFISQLELTEYQAEQMQILTGVFRNLASGDYLGAIVSIAASVIGQAASFLDLTGKKADDAKQKALEVQQKQADYLNEMIGLQVKYNLALNDQIRLQEGQTFFINDYVSQALNASNALIDIQTKYNDFLNSLQKTNLLGLGWMGDPSASEEQKKLTNAFSYLLAPQKIRTDGSYQMTSLLSLYPELIGENGKFNSALAKTLLNIQGLPDATKVALEGLIDYTDKLKENQEAINSAVESLAGSIGNDLYSALSNAWDQGTDSFMAFKDSVSAGLKDIVKQMLFNAVFSNSLKTLQTDLIASFSVGGDQNPVNDFSTFLNAAPELLKAWSEGMKGLDGQLTSAGIDPSSTTARTGTAKGIAQASQDSVDELNGRMTAVQAYIYDIRNINQQSFDFEKESRYYDSAILSQLETIAENTDYCRYLEKIDKTLNDIQLKGVKLKN